MMPTRETRRRAASTNSALASDTARPDFEPNTLLPRHRWYRFKEGFSAGLVEAFAKQYLPSNSENTQRQILDPFLGSGTTAVEGANLGCVVDGIETNPFMAFLAKVKTRDYTRVRDVESAALRCLDQRRCNAAFTLPNDTTLVERKGLDKWILNKSVASRFEQLRTAISELNPPRLRELLLLALLSSIEDVANARKDGKCWRYKSKWQQLRFSGMSLDEAFASQIIRFKEDISICPRLKGRATVVRGDARRHLSRVGNGEKLYDGILTSPPYLNSFDYTDIYRPELLLMQWARNSKELRKIRMTTLRSHVQISWKSSPTLEIPILQDVIASIGNLTLWSGRIPDMINAYFVDLSSVIEQCARRLKRGAAIGLVVADSAYCGVVIPVDAILREILLRHGFGVPETVLLRQTLGNGNHQKVSSMRLKEVIVVARYSPSRRL